MITTRWLLRTSSACEEPSKRMPASSTSDLESIASTSCNDVTNVSGSRDHPSAALNPPISFSPSSTVPPW